MAKKKQMKVQAPGSLSRWRLVLGKYAQPKMSDALNTNQQRMANALEQLYSREYQGRGVRQDPKLSAGLGPSALNVPQWLDEIQQLFPKDTYERITNHALDRYGMTELVQDPKVLASLEPSTELLGMVLGMKGHLNANVLAEVRKLIAKVVEEIKRKLEAEIKNAIVGRLNRFRHSQIKVARNFDARDTIRRNLKNWDPERQKIVVETPRFYSRIKRQMPWEVILCIDQSGSMAGSVIHSAVMAGILAGLPMVRVRLVVFDTSVLDLSEYVSDPVEVLMSVQLGGGTNIGQAVQYCERLVSQPKRTVLVLVTDFCEGADPRVLVTSCKRLSESGVKLIGLASLDMNANAWYDEHMAERLAADGMEIAALTPQKLALWLAQVMNTT